MIFDEKISVSVIIWVSSKRHSVSGLIFNSDSCCFYFNCLSSYFCLSNIKSYLLYISSDQGNVSCGVVFMISFLMSSNPNPDPNPNVFVVSFRSEVYFEMRSVYDLRLTSSITNIFVYFSCFFTLN